MMTSMSPHHVRRFGDVEEHISPGIVDSGENWDAENHATRAIVIDRLVTLSGVVEPVIDVRKLDPCACPVGKFQHRLRSFLVFVKRWRKQPTQAFLPWPHHQAVAVSILNDPPYIGVRTIQSRRNLAPIHTTLRIRHASLHPDCFKTSSRTLQE